MAAMGMRVSNRWQAAGVHLVLSALVGACVMAVLVFVWYPPPLFQAGGAARLAKTIVLVDVVMGPLLTLVVFKLGKPSLRFDLACIALLQVAALAYGLHIATQSRPVYLVAMPTRAVLVHANELYFDPPAAPAYQGVPWTGPRLVFADAPEDRDKRNALLFEVLEGLPDAEFRPGLYEPIEAASDRFWAAGEPVQQLIDAGTLDASNLRSWIQEGVNLEALRAIPLITRDQEMVLVVDPNRRVVLGPRLLHR